MTEDERRILEDVLVAEVVTLSAVLDVTARVKNGGGGRLGGDYTEEAVDLIVSRRSRVLELLRRGE